MKVIRYLTHFLVTVILWSCKVDPQIIPELPSNKLQEVIPQGWPAPVYTFTGNTLSQDKFILGRALFYEPMLSLDNSISCGSCHQQTAAFANADHVLSHGINGLKGKRNAPAIFNLNWHPYFMHDGGIINLELQPVGPITNPIEMAETMSGVVDKLKASAKYKNLYLNAYGTEDITSQGLLKAMAQFMGMIYSYNSKFDRYKRGENNTNLSEAEQRGYNLFKANCNACHAEPLFSDFKFRSNGLSVDPGLNDSGRAHVEPLPQNRYKFKTPSLRNVARSYPYMHDGRFNTLEKCLDHYTSEKTNTYNLDPLLQNPLTLSAEDKKDLIEFLNTLTDYSYLEDPRFADPNIPHP